MPATRVSQGQTFKVLAIVEAMSRRKGMWLVAPLLALLFLLPAVRLVHYIYFDRSGLPDLERFIRFEIPTTGEVYDAQGTVLVELAREYRRVVSYDEVPPVLRDAILAAEDRNFFTHSGLEYRALPRVAYKTMVRSVAAWWNGDGFRLRFPHGGSTLTQQLVRGYFLRDRSSREGGATLFRDNMSSRLLSTVLGVPATNKLLRKLEEMRLSIWLEREMRQRFGSQEQAKREIFARYSNFNYLGNGRYGFAAASEYYFGMPLSSYTAEDAGNAALLAGITKSPRDYAPVPGDPRPLRRRNEILALMARNGYITADVAKRSQAEPVVVATENTIKTQAPAAINTVFAELKEHGFAMEDLFQGRILVHSTVDERVQTIVNEALENGLALYEERHPEAKGVIQGSVVVLRNAVAVWITRKIGVDGVIETSQEFGIRTPLQPYITTALGASEVRLLELAGAYRAMASGILAEPHIIDRVTDAAGAVLYEAFPSTLEVESTGLSLIQEGLRGVVRLPGGTAHALDGRDFLIPVMGKTGTTSDFRDALFVGSTYGPTGSTVAVRIGFDDNRTLGDKETGGRTALPIFREIMLRAYRQEIVGPVPEFPRAIEERIDQYLVGQAALKAKP